jgi:hypothetical protein
MSANDSNGSNGSKGDSSKGRLDYDVSMRRLFYLALVGCGIILLDALGTRPGFLRTFSVGLMTAGAAMFVGGLLGFLFGVPYTREGEQPAGNKGGQGGQQNESGSDAIPTSYRPNTSLEQISDWLTKILVGVGLVQIKTIPEKLKGLAAYIAQDLGGAGQANAFVLTVLIYFSVCGFVFGFLWARIYLRRWFKEADQDEVRRLDNKLNQLEARQLSDAKALTLVAQQLKRGADDPAVPEEETASAIRAASTPVKVQIFDSTQRVSENTDAEDYDVKNQSVIAIFKGLIASDPTGRFHKNHSELSYALSRRRPPDLVEAEKNMSAAIEIRDRLGKNGWKYYELRRARYRIQLDPNFKMNRVSDADSRARILADLRAAHKETDKWDRWVKDNPDIQKWMDINKVDDKVLQSP